MASMLDKGEMVAQWHCAIGMHGCTLASMLIPVSTGSQPRMLLAGCGRDICLGVLLQERGL